MPASSFVARSFAEALAFGAVASPAFFVYFSLLGVVEARFLPTAVASSPASSTQTFGGLASHALRYGLGCSARTVGFCGAAAAISAGVREALHVGPRYEDASLTSPLFHAGGVAGGVAAASLVTADWASSMGRGRRTLFLLFSGFCGALLPVILAAAGPGVRRRLTALAPAAAPPNAL